MNDTSKGIHLVKKEEIRYSQRHILVDFLQKIPMTAGWWFSILVFNSQESNDELNLCLPHFGTIFGLTEDVIVIVLMEMVSLSWLRVWIKNSIKNSKQYMGQTNRQVSGG